MQPSPLPVLTLVAPTLPPSPECTDSHGSHSHVIIQIVVENGPQLELLKAADRGGQAQMQVEFLEDADTGRCGYTQACGWGKEAGAEVQGHEYLRAKEGRVWQ